MSALCFDKFGNNIGNAIFGYTGFVGNNLIKHYKFDYYYNSSNIDEAIDMEYNNIFICCIPSIKWIANKYPEDDMQSIENIQKILKTITANKVYLISTIDIYNNINDHSCENTVVNFKINHA